ncbi:MULTISPECIES: TauD/TfdA dioxygenase family protein [unclassified Streptomyces]|uniref:TauD/TfdA dioxygenase family protein n=1 Tax=unclassified Streptomyces TaxID=2593676 RepID=UPI003663CC26
MTSTWPCPRNWSSRVPWRRCSCCPCGCSGPSTSAEAATVAPAPSSRTPYPSPPSERWIPTATRTAPTTRITVRQIAGHMGAEISGVDLREGIDDAGVAEIRRAVLTHRVVFLRGQRLYHARHVAFGRRFRALTRRPGKKHGDIYRQDPQVAVHPVVRVHPETGERALFVSPGSTTRIVGFSEIESRHRLEAW